MNIITEALNIINIEIKQDKIKLTGMKGMEGMK